MIKILQKRSNEKSLNKPKIEVLNALLNYSKSIQIIEIKKKKIIIPGN